MTATDGRTRTGGGDAPGPVGPSDPGEPARVPRAPEPASPPDGGPAIARARARTPSGPGPVPPGVARRVGRHARPDSASTMHTPPEGYRPRHAAPDAETERFSLPSDPTRAPVAFAPAPGSAAAPPAGARPVDTAAPAPPTPGEVPAADPTPVRGLPLASSFPAAAVTAASGPLPLPSNGKKPLYGWDDAGSDPGGPPPERQRVVLAERRLPTRAVGTVAEIEQQTATGELLLSNLMRSQLMLAVRLTLVAALLLGALPVLFLTVPAVGGFAPLLGIGLPWWLLGVLPFPLLLLVASLHVRAAERNELDFADDVEG